MKQKILLFFSFFVFLCSFANNPVHKTINYQEIDREYIVYTPSSASTNEIAGLVICLHGFNGKNTNFFEGNYNAIEFANKLNLMLIAPQALSEQNDDIKNTIKQLKTSFSSFSIPELNYVWGCGLEVSAKINGANAPLGPIELNKDVDDAGFINAILERTVDKHNLQGKSVFVLGLSMGGYMSYQYALKHGNKLSGLIPIAASMGLKIKDESADVKLPICDFHSTTDLVVPYSGTTEHTIPFNGSEFNVEVSLAKPKKEVIQFWVKKNGTSTVPIVEELNYYNSTNEKKATKYTYESTEYEVIHYELEGADHGYIFKKSRPDCIDYYEEIEKFIRPKLKNSATNLIDLSASDQNKTLSFYPNPAKDIIHFTNNNALVEIYSISGQKVMSNRLNSSSMDISHLRSGVYIIQITSNNSSYKDRLIIK